MLKFVQISSSGFGGGGGAESVPLPPIFETPDYILRPKLHIFRADQSWGPPGQILDPLQDFYLKMKDMSCHINPIGADLNLHVQTLHSFVLTTKKKNNWEVSSEFEDHIRPPLNNGSRSSCLCEFFHQFNLDNEIFACQNGQEKSLEQVNDLVPDCGPMANDEYLLKTLATGTKYLCSKRYQLPCIEGHTKCCNISEICSYKLNSSFILILCRTGQHLENCKEFRCNMMFKCPEYYCIPWSYVCDGNRTVLMVMTTIKYNVDKTYNMFKCKYSLIGIHLNDVCDGDKCCPSGDGE